MANVYESEAVANWLHGLGLQIPRGILSRTRKINSIPLIPEPGMKLSLLVENQGRINVDVNLNSDKKVWYSFVWKL